MLVTGVHGMKCKLGMLRKIESNCGTLPATKGVLCVMHMLTISAWHPCV